MAGTFPFIHKTKNIREKVFFVSKHKEAVQPDTAFFMSHFGVSKLNLRQKLPAHGVTSKVEHAGEFKTQLRFKLIELIRDASLFFH